MIHQQAVAETQINLESSHEITPSPSLFKELYNPQSLFKNIQFQTESDLSVISKRFTSEMLYF